MHSNWFVGSFKAVLVLNVSAHEAVAEAIAHIPRASTEYVL